MMKTLFGVLSTALLAATTGGLVAQDRPAGAGSASRPRGVASENHYGAHFETSDRCVACHNGITTPAGEDVSVGVNWRTSMMANSARDPYWMAGVRRELIDHPAAAAQIQDECTICHMPMMRYEARLAGREGNPFDHLPPDLDDLSDRLADDGVSCSVCHQITDRNLGTRDSFVGRFKVDEEARPGDRRVFGPFEVSKGHVRIMRSSSAFEPTQASHIQSSELCATCHTLITQSLDAEGRVIGEFPEQVPYQEWQHSDYQATRTCQSCHMPVIEQEVPITSVFGESRSGVARHTFVGGNFFMQRILSRFRTDLSVQALPQELDAAARRTVEHLQSETARVTIEDVAMANGRLQSVIGVSNLGGHKLPTAYPSRRAWLHVSVKDRNGRTVFDSGSLNPDGSIQGNDNDEDATRFEPHYAEVSRPDQVQIYESIMVGSDGAVTTGLLTALRYVKDNRLLPLGFDKRTAGQDVAVHGDAQADDDFTGGGDRIRYSMAVDEAQAPFRLEAELWFQPIAYRWAMNLKNYDAAEPNRFVSYYEASASGSGVRLASASATR